MKEAEFFGKVSHSTNIIEAKGAPVSIHTFTHFMGPAQLQLLQDDLLFRERVIVCHRDSFITSNFDVIPNVRRLRIFNYNYDMEYLDLPAHVLNADADLYLIGHENDWNRYGFNFDNSRDIYVHSLYKLDHYNLPYPYTYGPRFEDNPLWTRM